MTVEEVKEQIINILVGCNACIYEHYLKILDDIVRSKQFEESEK